ncbi:MAG: hypothetical protein P8M71_00535 [Pseudomonadales bacterium]|nr:hypothetical protein [Pseudomonadales bacterium]
MKGIFRIFNAVAILSLLALFMLINNLGGVIKSTINDRSESLLGVPIAVVDVDVNVFTGQITLTDFSVKNPEGFSAVNAMSVASLSIDIAPLSILDPIVIIDSIEINGAQVNAEQKGKRLNLDLLRRKLSGDQPTDDSSADIDSTKSLPNIAIAKFEFSSASISVRSTQLGQTTLRVPSITVNDIGLPDKGITVDEAMRLILDHLLQKLRQQVKLEVLDKAVEGELNRQLDKALRKSLGDKAEQAKSLLKGLFNQ